MILLQQYPILKDIRDLAKRRRTSLYLVGGFLRDHLLGLEKTDFDFAVSHDALDLAQRFAKGVKGAFIPLDPERGCARVAKKFKGTLFTFDFADFRGPDLMADLSARDFTINTLCVHLNALEATSALDDVLCDYKKGLCDLKLRRIKMTSAKVFGDDPLRMMRAFSLKALLGFSIDKSTLEKIGRQKELIRLVSGERVRDELFKVLGAPCSAPVIKEMDAVGLLALVIPQLRVMENGPQGGYHHLDIWPHCLETLVQLHVNHGFWHEFWPSNLWAATSLLASLGLFALGATGIYLWFAHHKERLIGGALLAVGLLYGLATLWLTRVA